MSEMRVVRLHIYYLTKNNGIVFKKSISPSDNLIMTTLK